MRVKPHIQIVGAIVTTILHHSDAIHASSFVPSFLSKKGGATAASSPPSTRDLHQPAPFLVDPTQSSNDSGGDGEKEESWEGFNPFKRKASSTPLPSILASPTVSVRKIRMQELTNELLLNVSMNDDDDADAKAKNADILNSILSKNTDLLLEPLEEDNAVGMDEDSIYDAGMTRDERFERYESVMREREAKAVNKSVKKVLGVMREFVMQRK